MKSKLSSEKQDQKDFLSSINESYYFSRIKKYKYAFIVSGILALICTLISYPGIMYSDSYGRVELANEMIFVGGEISSWLTPTPSYFIALSKFLTNSLAPYTFVQAFVFFISVSALIIKIGTPYKKVQLFLAVFSPMVWAVSVYYEAGIGCVSGIIIITAVIFSLGNEKTRADRIFEIILLTFFSFVTFGYRANAFTIFPIIIGGLLFSSLGKRLKLMGIGSILVGFLLVPLSAKLLNINTMSSKSAGFVWDILSSINRLDPEERNRYSDWFDSIAEPGATADALEKNNEESVNGFIWDSKLNTTVLSSAGAFSETMRKYLEFIRKQPSVYFKVKFGFIGKALGITSAIRISEFDYNRGNRMDKYGFFDTGIRKWFVNSYIWFIDALGFYTLRPIVFFLISLLLVIYSFVKKDKNRRIYLFILLISIFYYGAFIINSQSFEIRYFYPALLLMTVMNTAIVSEIVSRYIKQVKKKAPLPERPDTNQTLQGE